MSSTVEPSNLEALQQLDQIAPGVPLLALGQTVFWDEPMKASVALTMQMAGSNRSFVAGVHDTDYFAKHPQRGQKPGFVAFPHNDTTTRDLWSAAGEFSSFLGSETVITSKMLAEGGAKLALVERSRPRFLDEATEAFGWRGVASTSKESRITADKPMAKVFPALFKTFEWAVDETLACITGPKVEASRRKANELLELACRVAQPETDQTLADYYEALLPEMYRFASGEQVSIETTRTTQLLKFNRETAELPRFKLVDLFLDPKTRDRAKSAYDQAIDGSEIYPLDKFGVGAIPFDLVIPGVGRGTLRIGTAGGLVMTPNPIGFRFKKPIESIQDLAAVIEDRFGPDCVLVGKAVTLIGMVATEFVFVFHYGASGYLHRSRKLHQLLNHRVYPLLRVTYQPWDAFDSCCSWIKLPSIFARPFGVEEMCAPSFSRRWREVAAAETQRRAKLSTLRKTPELVNFLQEDLGGHWKGVAEEYGVMQAKLAELHKSIEGLRKKRRQLVNRAHELKAQIEQLQHQKGEHWRAKLFEKVADPSEYAIRESFESQIRAKEEEVREVWAEWRAVKATQDAQTSSNDVQEMMRRRESIALEVELARIKLIREAVTASIGMSKAGQRPSAWWFPLLCPDGTWFRSTMRGARMELEQLD